MLSPPLVQGGQTVRRLRVHRLVLRDGQQLALPAAAALRRDDGQHVHHLRLRAEGEQAKHATAKVQLGKCNCESATAKVLLRKCNCGSATVEVQL